MRLTFPASNWTGLDATLSNIRTDDEGRVRFDYAGYDFTAVWDFSPDAENEEDGDDFDFLSVRVYRDSNLTDTRAIREDGTPDPAWAVAQVCLFTRDLDPSYRYGGIHARGDDCSDLERSGPSILVALGRVLANTV